jgi:hypothetical protein
VDIDEFDLSNSGKEFKKLKNDNTNFYTMSKDRDKNKEKDNEETEGKVGDNTNQAM